MRGYVEQAEAAGLDPGHPDTPDQLAGWERPARVKKVDDALLAWRAEPTDATEAALFAAMEASVEGFYAEQTAEFIARTSGTSPDQGGV